MTATFVLLSLFSTKFLAVSAIKNLTSVFKGSYDNDNLFIKWFFLTICSKVHIKVEF